MINLLLGAPGGGKSYEAVAFHLLPALLAGRKVITNLPLNLDALAGINALWPSLIELRTGTLAVRPEVDWAKAESLYKRFGIAAKNAWFNPYPFSHREDYGDVWRHPETGAGPLYIIDEAHIALPRTGTPRDVEEWYSLHRHETADVLLITQSFSKVNQPVVDLVQVAYRVRKNVAFGSSNSYTRKVQDGVRGEVVNTAIRKYDPAIFALYNSHTKGGGGELRAQDIVPFWKRLPVLLTLVFIPVGVGIMLWSGSPFEAAKSLGQKKPAVVAGGGESMVGKVLPMSARAPGISQDISSPVSGDVSKGGEPLAGRGIHQKGVGALGGFAFSYYEVSQNGQGLFSLSGAELQSLGYRVEVLGRCVSRLTYGASVRYVVCDVPQVSVGDSDRKGEGGKSSAVPVEVGASASASSAPLQAASSQAVQHKAP